MKQKYIIPAALTVQLGTCKMMAESLEIKRGGTSITSEEDILVKEQSTTDKNVWDDEW